MEKVLDGMPCVGLSVAVPDGRSESSKANFTCCVNAFEATSPSPESSKLLKLRKLVRSLADGLMNARLPGTRVRGFAGSRVRGFAGSRVRGFAGSRVRGFAGSRVRGFAGSRVRGFAGSRVRGFTGSRVRGFTGSRVRGFAGSRVRGFAGSRVRGCPGSRVRGFAGSRVRGFAGSRVRGFAGSRVRLQSTETCLVSICEMIVFCACHLQNDSSWLPLQDTFLTICR